MGVEQPSPARICPAAPGVGRGVAPALAGLSRSPLCPSPAGMPRAGAQAVPARRELSGRKTPRAAG